MAGLCTGVGVGVNAVSDVRRMASASAAGALVGDKGRETEGARARCGVAVAVVVVLVALIILCPVQKRVGVLVIPRGVRDVSGAAATAVAWALTSGGEVAGTEE